STRRRAPSATAPDVTTSRWSRSPRIPRPPRPCAGRRARRDMKPIAVRIRTCSSFLRHTRVTSRAMRTLLVLATAILGACGTDVEDPGPTVIHARFDPVAKVIPMPTDVLRDAPAGRLKLPIDDSLSDAEREFYGFLNTMDG